jgi:hypothetical protein
MYLSKGGRVTLIKSTLSYLSTYIMMYSFLGDQVETNKE